jgi:hypothetical protein
MLAGRRLLKTLNFVLMQPGGDYSTSAFSRLAVRVGTGADASLSALGAESAGGAASATGFDLATVVEPESWGAAGALAVAGTDTILSAFSAEAERVSSGVSIVLAWIGGGPAIAVRAGATSGALSA